MSETVYEVVYWPTWRVCATYDTPEEAEASRAWYEKTYGPLAHGALSVRKSVRAGAGS